MNDEYLIYGETLTAIANSIRSISSVSTTWTPDEMAAYILANLVKPTTRQAAKTYTPSTSNQTIPAGTFLTGAATIAGDADLTAANIKKGVNIFGKTGTLSGIWGDPTTFLNLTAVKSGSVTISSISSGGTHTITHNLGVTPKAILWALDTPYITTTETRQQGGFYMKLSDTFWLCYVFFCKLYTSPLQYISYWVNLGGSEYSAGYANNIAPTSTTFNIVNGRSSGVYASGTFKWAVMA